MIGIVVSLVSFLLGILALRRIYELEKAAGSSLLHWTFVYFFSQHVAFGLGGLLMAIFDQGYNYVNLQGSFPYSDTIVPLQLLNLVSILAGLGGVRIAVGGTQRADRQLTTPTPGDQARLPSKDLTGQGQALRTICYVSLAMHAFIIGLQWYAAYRDVPTIPVYFLQVMAPLVGATFYFWGLCWPQAGRERFMFVTYVLVYGLVQLASGGRGTFLAGVLVFSIGYLQARDWRLRRRDVAAIVVCAAMLLWLITISENVRLLNPGRRPADAAEWLTRSELLLRGAGITGETESFNSAIFRSAVGMTSYGPPDVIARTPEDIPYAGWSDDDWYLLFRGVLPEFGISDIVTASNKGVLTLRDYGWAVDPAGGNAIPVSFLADSWRRFGIIGVIVANFILAALLARLSVSFGGRDFRVFHLIFSGAVIITTYRFFLCDILQLAAWLPRRILACLIYATIISVVHRLHVHRSSKSSPSPRFPQMVRNTER